MGQESQKATTSEVVRIWKEPKKRLARVLLEKSKKEKRPITETELVSKAVDALCKIEERKLGII